MTDGGIFDSAAYSYIVVNKYSTQSVKVCK